MIYTTLISLLIERPFYLLRPQSFSFQRVSEFIDMCVKFSTFMSRGWGFDSLFCPEGRVFVRNDCPGGRVLLPSSRVRGGLVEIDPCIKYRCYKNLKSLRGIAVKVPEIESDLLEWCRPFDFPRAYIGNRIDQLEEEPINRSLARTDGVRSYVFHYSN